STNKGITVNEGDHFSVTPQRIQGNIYNNGGFKTSVPRVQGEVYTFSIEVNTQQDVQILYRQSEFYYNSIPSTNGECGRYEFTYTQIRTTREAGSSLLV